MQTNIFDYLYKDYKIHKPIRLIELFAGYGSQSLALDYLGVEYESHKICEWAIPSILAYKQIHNEYDIIRLDMTREELAQKLFELGVSLDYNKPAELKQLQRKSLEYLRNTYEAILVTKNQVNIMNIRGKDLKITDTDAYEYIMTYSFPCQDLSLAGKSKGMSDNTTRSGLLWEVERILLECDEKPQVLIMENVSAVHNNKNINDFEKWQKSLVDMGYTNFYKDLNAKDFGITQKRVRTFMVSILDKTYTFPKSIQLKTTIKDFECLSVDKKYYLTNQQLLNISKWKAQQKPLKTVLGVNSIVQTITARGAGNMHSGMVIYSHNFKDVTNITDKLDTNLENENKLSNIRYITPTEAFRLMGVKDFDSNKIKQNDNIKYHLAGDSIVTTVLMAVFGQLLGIDYQQAIEQLLQELII